MKIQNYKLFFLAIFLFLIFSARGGSAFGGNFSFVNAAEWSGVDETVVEKYAEEHGRVARKPFINTDQGDLLLFVFLLAGAIGGFAAGYCWRKLIEQKPKNNNAPIHRTF